MPGESPRRVLLYIADQWRGDTMTSEGHPCVDTPNIDRLASEGVTFRRHYTTASPCGPARTSLLTGLYLMNHRVVRNGTPLDARHTNIAYELRKAGIAPAMFGYTSNVPDSRVFAPDDPLFRDHHGVMQGFDALAPGLPWSSPYMGWARSLGYDLPDDPEDFWLPHEGRDGDERGATFAPARFTADHSPTAFLTEETIKYLSVRESSDWFVHLATLAPHPPFIAPEPYNSRFSADDVPQPIRARTVEEEAAQHPLLAYLLKTTGQKDFIRSGNGLAASLEERDIRQVRATYYGMIAETDYHFGRLIEYLKETGQYDSTLVIFSSDHGEHLGDHYLLGKAGYFDSAYHIPLIVRFPGASAGTTVESFSESIDIVPTILDWLGCEIPVTWDGESLLPYCRGETLPRPRDAVYYEHDFREVYSRRPQEALRLTMEQCSLAAIRDERFKYVHFPTLPPLLFDLREDPKELRNLAGDPGHAATVRDYAQRMLSLRMEHMDRTLTWIQAGPEGLKSVREPRR